MSEIIYLLTVLYATYVIDSIVGEIPVFVLSVFGMLIYLQGVFM
jgi:hypothetical protein